MQVTPNIVFKNFEASIYVRERVARELERLGKFHPRITSCRVVVERATGRRKSGDLYRARVFLALPGGREVAATRTQDDAHAHEDVLVAVRDAFDAAQRRIEDQTRVQRGDVKAHAAASEGRIARFLAEQDAGFIETDDGREIYFHRNALSGKQFESLTVGDRVRFHEEDGDRGAQASTVALKRARRGAKQGD